MIFFRVPQAYTSGVKGLVQFCYRNVFFLVWSVSFQLGIVFDIYQLVCCVTLVSAICS